LSELETRRILQAIEGVEFLVRLKFEDLKGEIQEVKNLMADLNQTVADLQNAVQGVADRVGQLVGPLQQQISELQTALQTERDAAAALAAAEDQEDVEQNQNLADAQAATDAALQNASQAADSIQSEVGRLNEVAATPGGGEPVA
jgi:peptidoglycan hydrolase CwlO-like protein